MRRGRHRETAMGAGASSAASESSAGPNRGGAKLDLRGERYFVQVDFIAPPGNKKLSNNLALYFKGSNSQYGRETYSPRIYPAKIASDQKDDGLYISSSSKEFRSKEELKTSTQVFDAKLTGLGGNAYRYSFEFRDTVIYGDICMFYARNVGSDARANLRVEEARITKIMTGGLKCDGETFSYVFPCHCNLLFGTEKHFYESRSYLPSETPFHLMKWRNRYV